MIQDIYPMKLDNAFEMKEPDADSRILAFRDRTVYLKTRGRSHFLSITCGWNTVRHITKKCPDWYICFPWMTYLFI